VSARSEQAARTRQSVLDAARRLFFAHGYAATSLQDIADELGVAKANVYYYFRTKDSLMAELLAERIRDLATVLADASAIEERDTRAQHLIDGFVEQVVIAHRSLAPVDFADPVIRSLPDVSARIEELTVRAATLLFGPAPTPRQRASLALVLDLKPALRELTDLPDADIRAALSDLCRALFAAS
jgi:AcrR family transcriptional regulator